MSLPLMLENIYLSFPARMQESPLLEYLFVTLFPLSIIVHFYKSLIYLFLDEVAINLHMFSPH